MFGTQLSPAHLIKKQQIAKEFLATDLFFIGRKDDDWQEGYKPHVMEAQTLRDVLLGQISILDLIDTPNVLGNPGDILQVNPAGTRLIFVEPLDEFIELIDTPADYVGFAGARVVVNSTEDGLEFQILPPTETRFEARVTFDLVDDPVVAILHESSISVVVSFVRMANGVYRAEFSQPVVANNLIMWIGNTTEGIFVPTFYATTYIEFEHHTFLSGISDANMADVSVEIKLYP